MKKFAVILALTVVLCGCFGNVQNDDLIGTDEVGVNNETSSYPRTEDISAGKNADSYADSFTYKYDMDFDGVDENIDINILNPGYENEVTELKIGEYTKPVETWDAMIEKVYICDIDVNDGVRDLALITSEVSSDVRLRVVKYDENLTDYNFYLYREWDDSWETSDCMWLGYPESYYFNVNDDDTLTIEEQTSSIGMWSVYKTYQRNEDGSFTKTDFDYYEILPDFMENMGEYLDDGEEKDMWQQGYVKAYKDYESDGITINEGEYFKVIYDDGKDSIYIEKEDGQSGWIGIDYNMCEVNEHFFFLAG